jgi:subtilisin family serine protease
LIKIFGKLARVSRRLTCFLLIPSLAFAPLPLPASVAAADMAAAALLTAPHLPASLLVKLPPVSAQTVSAQAARRWPQGVQSASFLFGGAATAGDEVQAMSAAVYSVTADTTEQSPYAAAPDALPVTVGSSAGSEPGDWYVLRVDEGRAAAVLSALLSDPAVLAAEPDYLISAAPFTQKELRASALTQDHLDYYGIPQGLSLTDSPGHGARVAVLDSGVDITHPDLSMNIDSSYTGRQNFTAEGNPTDISDGYGHGTMVAGLIAANGLARGVAPNAKIIPIKVLDNSGSGSTSSLIAAMNAVRDYADIINLSLGSITRSEALDAAVLNAWQSNCLVIASAGNEGLPNGPVDGSGVYAPSYPAASAGVIGVMAAETNPAAGEDHLASFSNWDTVPDDRVEYHILAPGSALQSTAPNGAYKTNSGTSFAAPVVSGMAAVLLSYLRDSQPGVRITNAELFTRITGSGENVKGKTVAGKVYSLREARLDNMMGALPAPLLLIGELEGDLTAGAAANQLSLEIFALRGVLPAATARITAQTAGVRFDGGAAVLNTNLGELSSNNGKTFSFDVYVSPELSNGTEAVFTVVLTGGAAVTLRKTVRRATSVGGDLTAARSVLDSSSVWIIDAAAVVPAGKTLTITAGAEVLFNAGLTNAGSLIVEGAADRPVTLLPGDKYDRVTITNSTGARSTFNYVTITNPELNVSSVSHARWSGHGSADRPLCVKADSVVLSQVFDFSQAVISADLDSTSFSYLAGVAISGASITNCTFMNNIMPSKSGLALTSLNLSGRPVFHHNAVLTPLAFITTGSSCDLRSNYFDLTHSAYNTASDFGDFDELSELAPGCNIVADSVPQPSVTAACPPFILYAEALPAPTVFSDYFSNRLVLTFNTDMAATQPALELLREENIPAFFYDKRAVSGEWLGPRTWQINVQTGVPWAVVSAAGLSGAKDSWLRTEDGERRLRVNLSVSSVNQSITLTADVTSAGVTLNWNQAAGAGVYTVYRQPDGEAPQNMGARTSPWLDALNLSGLVHYYIRTNNNIASNIVTAGSSDSGGGGNGGGGGGSGGGGGGGGGGGSLTSAPPVNALPEQPIIAHISGADRVQTSVLISKRGWDSADAVVLAPGAQANLIDALAAAPLAGQENAPILLSVNGALATEVTAEIKRLGATRIYAVGALAPSVTKALADALPSADIIVLRGQNRLETARLLNAQIKETRGIFLVGYNGLPDALSVASFAAAHGYLIQIANPDGSVEGDIREAENYPLYILGGPSLVRDIPGATRLYGADRYATNAAVLNALPFDTATVYTANGQTLVDALTGSLLAAQTNSPIVLRPGGDLAALPAGLEQTAARIYAFGG